MRRSSGILMVTIVGVAVGCTFPPPPGATVLAIAYTNVDGVKGFDESRGAVLIAKLVDTNGDGAASAGDTVITNQYPTSTATGFIDEFRSGAAGGTDFIAVDPMSPSRPEDSIPDRPSFDGQGDDTFVEVDLFIALP